MKRALAAVVVLGLLPLAACGGGNGESAGSGSGDPGHVTRADFGDDWPFTLDEGTIRCDGSGGVGAVTFEAAGVTYAVNGIARGQGQYEDVAAIWADDPSIAGAKKDIGPIIDRGLELCP